MFFNSTTKTNKKEEKQKQISPLWEKAEKALQSEICDLSIDELDEMSTAWMDALWETSLLLLGERDGEMVNARLLTATPEDYRKIAQKYPISHQRVWQIVERARKHYHRFLSQGTKPSSFRAREYFIPILLCIPDEQFIPLIAYSYFKNEFMGNLLTVFTAPPEHADAYCEAIRQCRERQKRQLLSLREGGASREEQPSIRSAVPEESGAENPTLEMTEASATTSEPPLSSLTTTQNEEKNPPKEKRTLTEVEKIAYAKLFIDKMAMGQNPIDNTPIPEGDTLNQVRISRCLFYVSGILAQVIECGGIPPIPPQAPTEEEPKKKREKKEKKPPFTLTEEQIAQITPTDSAILVRDFVRMLNAVRSEEVAPISKVKCNLWLVSLGLMERLVDAGGGATYLPTEFGMEIGIDVEMKMGYRGPYPAIVLKPQAQSFLTDNIGSLFELVGIPQKKGAPWTPEDEEKLVELYQSETPLPLIALKLSRTRGAVKARLSYLGLIQ